MKLLLLFLLNFHFGNDTLKKESYQILVPENWTIKENCEELDCSMLSPQENNTDTFLENINVVVQKVENPNHPIDKNVDYAITFLPTVIENFELLERKKLPNKNEYIIYKGVKDDFKQTWKQYFYFKNKKVFIITFCAETDKFEEFLPKIQPILDSFKMI